MSFFHNPFKPILLLSYLILLIVLLFVLYDLYHPVSLAQNHQFATIITAEDGTPLRAFANRKSIWAYPVELNQVSPLYQQALINYEDRWFWYHPGINPLSLCRALIQNIIQKKIISGGSTLTMQVARILSPHKRTFAGKFNQILMALQLELHYSKKEILTYYMNHAPFGGTIEGIQAASYTYLGKPVTELSHAEAALLTVLPQAPSRNRPDRHPQRALKVRNKVLRRLAHQLIWSKKIVEQALVEPLISQHTIPPMKAPLLARRLKHQLPKKPVIKTTIDYEMQNNIASRVKDYVTYLPDKTSIAVLVVENQTLKVKSYIGSADFYNLNRFAHVDMVQAIRSPGSTLKPFLYGIAIDEGLIHSQSLLSDAPISFDGYRPLNFSRGFIGPVSVQNALKRSLNIPAVQVLYFLTPEKFVSSLKNAGLKLIFNNHAKPNLSVILGGVGSNLESLVGTYTSLANKGLAGKIRLQADSPFIQRYLLSQESAWIIGNILSMHYNSTSQPIILKTGTSYGHRDFWSIGVTSKYTIGVWIGRPDGTPLAGHYGANTATPLLISLVEKLQQASKIKKSKNVSKKTICWPLGILKSDTDAELCHETKQAWIANNNIPRTLPETKTNRWTFNPVTIHIGKSKKSDFKKDCHKVELIKKKIALWPLSIEPWIEKKFTRKSQLKELNNNCLQAVKKRVNELKIVYFDKNTKLHSASGSAKLSRIRLETIGGQGSLYWFFNGRLKYKTTESFIYHRYEEKGNYQVTVIDDNGNSDSITIEVL